MITPMTPEITSTAPLESHEPRAASLEPPVVRIEGISKSYQGQLALSDVSLTIGRGEIFALLGPNGAGKTTLLRILTGILLPDTGSVQILGTGGMSAVRDRVGYLPEERGLYKKQKIREYLSYLAELKGWSRADAKARVMTVLETVGMAAHADSTADTLSKGMAQRIQIAAALIHDPPFIILDEPFSGLDPVSARQMQDIVRAEKAGGRTVLLSTHQMEPVERLCDRLLMLHRGRTVLYSTPTEARARFAEGIVRVEHGERDIVDRLPEGFAVKESAPYVTFLIPPPETPPRAVIAALLEAGVDVRAFATVTPSLEDVFVRIVGEKG
jgi:ABC-2 type transport system ATP-binding protein